MTYIYSHGYILRLFCARNIAKAIFPPLILSLAVNDIFTIKDK